MTKIYRILGKRGRVTIPYAFRQQVGFGFNDVLSFTIQEDNSVLVRREKICDHCGGKVTAQEKDAPATLLDFLDSLILEQQREAVLHLSAKWASHGNVLPLNMAS